MKSGDHILWDACLESSGQRAARPEVDWVRIALNFRGFTEGIRKAQASILSLERTLKANRDALTRATEAGP